MILENGELMDLVHACERRRSRCRPGIDKRRTSPIRLIVDQDRFDERTRTGVLIVEKLVDGLSIGTHKEVWLSGELLRSKHIIENKVNMNL
jgi:hypothetical protein